MSAWSYIAYDGNGRRRKGVLIADGEAQARDALRERGLFPDTLSPAREGGSRLRLRGGGRIGAEDLAVVTRQLAVLIGAELPVDDALQAIMQSEVGGAARRVAAELRARVRDGLPLSRAMAAQGAAFPDYYIAAVSAGESSGELAQVFDTLADYIESRQAVREKTATALVYPAFVGSVSLVVAGVLLVNVAPEIVALFEQSGQPLPTITRVSLAIGNFLGANWPFLLAGLAALMLGIRALLRVPAIGARWDRFVLRLPLIGRLRRMRAGALYLRTLALVLSSRMPAVAAMRFAVDAIANTALRAEAAEAHRLVEQGRRMSSAMRGMRALSPIAVQLVESGERSGTLTEMSARAAAIAENALSALQQRLSTLLEPIMMMVVGGMVLLIVLSVMLPIFDLQTSFVQ